MSRSKQELYPSQVAEIAGCSSSTVKRYEKRGIISAARDHNGFRRYAMSEAIKLKELLATRTDVFQEKNRLRCEVEN